MVAIQYPYMYTVQTFPGEFNLNKITENHLLQSNEFKSNNMYGKFTCRVTENHLLQSGEIKSNNIYGKPTCRG